MTWLLFSAGRGPGECQLAVTGLVAALMEEAAKSGIKAALVESEPGPYGPLSALVGLDGEGAGTLARSWEGSVLWICPSPLRPGWGRKNWFVGVSLLALPPPSSAVREGDLRVETMRSSGAGGQHVNKTESAVRITHLPTGAVAVAREERSQHRNRALAMARLHAVLADQVQQASRQADRDRWNRHDSLERGNPVRTYLGPDFRLR